MVLRKGFDRIRRLAAGSTLGVLALVGVAAKTLRAATTGLPLTVTHGGVTWYTMSNTFGTHSFGPGTLIGCTTPTHCPTPTDVDGNNTPYGIGEGTLTDVGCSDSWDTMFGMTVDGAAFVAPGDVVDLQGTVVTAGPQTLSGLDTEVEFRFYDNRPVMRALFSFTNPSGSQIDVTVIIGGEYGSDDDAVIEDTETGDTTITAADGWYLTSDDGGQDCEAADGDPAITVARFDTAATTLPTTANVPGGGSNDYFREEFALSVPAGETRRIAFFSELHQFVSAAEARAQDFDDSEAVNQAFLWTGLSTSEQNEIVNWVGVSSVLEATAIPTLGDVAKLGLAGQLALRGVIAVRRR